MVVAVHKPGGWTSLYMALLVVTELDWVASTTNVTGHPHCVDFLAPGATNNEVCPRMMSDVCDQSCTCRHQRIEIMHC